MKIKIAGAFLLAALLGLAYWHHQVFGVVNLWEVPKLLANMRAKEFCSCHFMLKNQADYCLKRVEKGYPVFNYKIDPENQRVEFSNYIYSGAARVRSARLGCLAE